MYVINMDANLSLLTVNCAVYISLYRWWLILMLQTQATQPWGSTCTGESSQP